MSLHSAALAERTAPASSIIPTAANGQVRAIAPRLKNPAGASAGGRRSLPDVGGEARCPAETRSGQSRAMWPPRLDYVLLYSLTIAFDFEDV